MKGNPIPILIGQQKILINNPVGCKLIVFRIPDGFSVTFEGFPLAEKIERTFKIAVKGGCHYLSKISRSRINLVSIHFDNWQQIGRRYNKEYLLPKLKEEFLDYCTIDQNCYIDDRNSDHNNHESQDWTDCQLLQIVDLLISSIRYLYDSGKDRHKRDISNRLEFLIERWDKRKMINSRWAGGFVISEGFIHNGEWFFEQNIEHNIIDKQSSLFNEI